MPLQDRQLAMLETKHHQQPVTPYLLLLLLQTHMEQ